MIKKLFVFSLLSLTLMFATNAHAISIVDTGTPTGSTLWSLKSGQSLAGKFSLSTATTITDISGYMRDNSGGSLTLAIYGDGGTVPDIGNQLFSQQFTVAGTATGPAPSTSDWYGLSGLNVNLVSGDYWVAFEVRSADTYVGAMLNGAPSPLSSYAFKTSGGYFNFIGGTGLRIDSNPAPAPAAVPEPSTMLLLGSGLIGLVALRNRRKTQTV